LGGILFQGAPFAMKLRERAAAFLRRQGKEDLAQEVTGRGKQ